VLCETVVLSFLDPADGEAQLLMLYPIPPPPGFAFHVVEIMSSPRYHLKRMLSSEETIPCGL